MDPKLFIATKAFIVHNEKVLIVKESQAYTDGTNEGKFDVVGGRMRPGQNFEESLKREVLEETGLSVDIGNPFFVNEWYPVVRDEKWHVVGIFFECRATTDKVTLGIDHNEFRWIDPKDFRKVDLIDNLVPTFIAYLER
ncbi:NUDIX domain-containing protein [Patescibacteria group bacterium]